MTKDDMLQMRLQGYTYGAIGKQAGYSRQYIQQVLSPPKAIRDYVVKKYNGFCSECHLFVGVHGHIHHVGLEQENYNDIDNLQLLCISCHKTKHPTPAAPDMTQVFRNNNIIEYHKQHPEVTYAQLGKTYNITRQRIHQILKNI
jgi:hypothetical protein